MAQIDLGELRYQWFDHIFKGAPKPALLQDKVNYEVMGANTWKHAPSLAAMSDQTLRFYLSASRSRVPPPTAPSGRGRHHPKPGIKKSREAAPQAFPSPVRGGREGDARERGQGERAAGGLRR